MDKIFNFLSANWEHIVVIGLALRALALGLFDAIEAADTQKLAGLKRQLFIIQNALTYLLGKRVS